MIPSNIDFPIYFAARAWLRNEKNPIPLDISIYKFIKNNRTMATLWNIYGITTCISTTMTFKYFEETKTKLFIIGVGLGLCKLLISI